MTAPLNCETQRETFSEITTSFNGKFTAPPELVLLDLVGSKLSFRWYYGDIPRVEAEQILMSQFNLPGAFLIRNSSKHDTYCLSIKTFDKDGTTVRIKHFSIPKSGDHFVFMDRYFLTLNDLVDFFIMESEVGLSPSMAKHPCVRPAPTMQDISMENKDRWEMPREELDFVMKIGNGSFGESYNIILLMCSPCSPSSK
ncbi:Proto-oncogene tyrosine-protein kinase Yrk [Portunus trituberculatus]|uniref:Proto-oncogene tyrosine-protein kinase Yrk n=1 Tax=Portunus trituberculatus TaxID=210409 RepID=A0A5B7DH91_PORTR|nr:Proto-oncogene tyrosine-protein kinase Yrk [Portunus trituberculatus]